MGWFAGWSHFCKEDWKEEVKGGRDGAETGEEREGGKRNMGSMRGIKLALTAAAAVAESKDPDADGRPDAIADFVRSMIS